MCVSICVDVVCYVCMCMDVVCMCACVYVVCVCSVFCVCSVCEYVCLCVCCMCVCVCMYVLRVQGLKLCPAIGPYLANMRNIGASLYLCGTIAWTSTTKAC